ncbi:MAG: hypothetical protein HY331_08055 [Chloroflexi bacterium]|nr:hypothetical protein [Chloroflexota bacterium]
MGPRWMARVALVLAIALLASAVPARTLAGGVPAPALKSPTDALTAPSTPLFTWSAVGGAVAYRFQLSIDPAFGTTIANAETVNLAFSPTSRLGDRDLSSPYYWRVASKSADGTLTYGDVWTFAVNWQQNAGPTLLGPANGATLTVPQDSVLLQWNAIANADGYKVEVASVPTFTGAQTFTTKNPAISLDPSLFVEGTTYYWRVAGTRQVGTTTYQSAWSENRSFTKRWQSALTPQSPADGFTPTLYETWFSWQPIPGAKQYQVQVSPNGDWANNVVYGGTEASPLWINSPAIGPLTALEDNQYYWRVRARDASNTNGQWSQPQTFQKAWQIPPTVVSPADNAQVSVPIFTWDPVDGASQYELQVSADPSFVKPQNACSPFWISVLTDQTSYVPIMKSSYGHCMPRNATLYWRVRAVDERTGSGTMLFGPWSESGLGRKVIWALDAPTPIAPAHGSTVTTPELSWGVVEQADRYHVVVVDEKGTARSFTTSSLTLTPTDLGKLYGTFSWQVNAVDADGMNGPYLGAWTFTLVTPTTGSDLTILGPANGATSYYLPSMRWTSVEGAETYRVWYRKQGETVYTSLISESGGETKYTSYTYPYMLIAGTYDWWVEARSKTGTTVAASEVRRFAVQDLPLVVLTGPTSGSTQSATPALHWQSIPWASHYNVWVAKDSLFNVTYHNGDTDPQYRTILPAYRPIDSYQDTSAGQGYFWIIRPCKADDRGGSPVCTPISATDLQGAWTYSKSSAAPTLLGPGSDATYDATPVFRWARVQGARNYRIQVAKDSNFATTSLIDDTLTDASYYQPVAEAYPDGALYWRVQGIDSSGNSLTFSETRSFVKMSPAPALQNPQANATVGNAPYFTWTPVTGAVSYDIQISIQNTFGTLYDSATVVGTTSHVPRTKSYAPNTYYWRVRGKDVGGNPMTWSAVGSFVVTVSAPTLIDPADRASVGGQPVFRWSAVPGAGSYQVVVQSGGTSFETVTVSNNFWAPTKDYPLGTYSWQVTSRDWSGNAGQSSETWTFNRTLTSGSGSGYKSFISIVMRQTSAGW